METTFKQLYSRMEEDLERLDAGEEDTLSRLAHACHIAEAYLRSLREQISNYSFASPEEKITFYKVIEPRFHSYLIYFTRVYQIESRQPVGGEPKVKAYLETELEKIFLFFRENEDFYRYYRTGAHFMDETFFLPGSDLPDLAANEYNGILDEQLCTAHGFIAARIIASEKLKNYLVKELEKLEQSGIGEKGPKYNCRWTGPKAALTELMYALIYGGMINNGQVEVKELATCLEDVFQTKMGNYYRVKQEIYTRKNPTAFLDLLKKRLREGLDESDEKYRRTS